MSKDIKIEVTQEDIDRGEKGDCAKCPIARAIRRTLKVRYVHVDTDFLEWGPDYSCMNAPVKVSKFIDAFDEGRRVSPFTFMLKDLDGE